MSFIEFQRTNQLQNYEINVTIGLGYDSTQ